MTTLLTNTDILSFYNYIYPWNVKNLKCLALNCDSNKLREVSDSKLYSIYDYIEGSQKIYRASKSIYSNEMTSLHRKLHSAFAYCNMGKASSAQEEKFMNAWIALESLCRGDAYDNIILNILETVPPALCLRYIYQHFRNFIEDCIKRCGVELRFSDEMINISPRGDNEENVKQIIKVFRDSALYNELLNKCAVNSLLHQRCEELHQIATDSQKMFDKIEHHHSTVRRQLSRLYRIRNEIAHNAMVSSSSLILYIEHLDDYLSRFVVEVVMCAERKGEESPEIIFEIIKDNYYTFVDIVHDKKNKKGLNLVLAELLESGIINLI